MNRVIITIDDTNYTVVTDESEEYVRRAAGLVDQEIRSIKAATPFSELTSAVLAAMNIADRYYKSQASVENMRAQIRSYADECAHLRSELNKLKKK
jgi:cell division protein ZapA